ncbi:Protein kinase superfamily protein [Abeliophyllum distichum]|uniref:Protein kinase superfamily protein n=1 Tax=Abeliophyllum distichum TaxID=126358 RepID=A0ABD1SIJ9_9LAMI
MEQVSGKKFPLNAKDYKLYEEVGEGVSATVYRALCIPLNEIVAIKVLDLEKCNSDLDGIRREVQTMILIDHPNVVRAHCSFTTGHNLWVVMPYMAGGSCLHIMKSSYPEGFEEPYRQKKDFSNSTAGEDVSEGAVVQRKGRFKVTSADLSPKGSTNCFFNPITGGSTSPMNPSLAAASVLPSLQYILQQNTMQREEIFKLIKFVEQTSGNPTEFSEVGVNDLLQIPVSAAKERELQAQVIQLQQSIGSVVEELQRQKTKNTQLEKKLESVLKKDEKT